MHLEFSGSEEQHDVTKNQGFYEVHVFVTNLQLSNAKIIFI